MLSQLITQLDAQSLASNLLQARKKMMQKSLQWKPKRKLIKLRTSQRKLLRIMQMQRLMKLKPKKLTNMHRLKLMLLLMILLLLTMRLVRILVKKTLLLKLRLKTSMIKSKKRKKKLKLIIRKPKLILRLI